MSPSPSSPDIVHADDALIIVDKPAGLLTVPGRGDDKQDCLWSRVRTLYADALIVHRLDMATSGLCVFARGALAQRTLSMAFAARQVHKRYAAEVWGQVAISLAPSDDTGNAATQTPRWQVIDLPLISDWPNRPKSKVDTLLGKPSITRYQVLQHCPEHGTTRLLLEPLTGRSHQLRVHLLAIGHPIVGDALYAPPAAAQQSPRLMLHASSLAFNHPVTGQPLQFSSPATIWS